MPRDDERNPRGAPPASPKQDADRSRLKGRVSHDSRGNAQWTFDISTGTFRQISTEDVLKSLDSTGLELVADVTHPGLDDTFDRPPETLPSSRPADATRPHGASRKQDPAKPPAPASAHAPKAVNVRDAGGDPYNSGPTAKKRRW